MRKSTFSVVALVFPMSVVAAWSFAQETAKEQKPWTDHFMTLKDGTKLHYIEMGKGTPVILIHGAGSLAERWFVNGIGPALAKTNRVLALDMRNHGLTEAKGQGSMPNDVLEFMDQQKITKAHIGGYSMGGMVTSQLLATNPEKFITAAFGGSGISETPEWADKIPKDKTGDAPDEIKAREARAARQQAVASAGGAAATPARGERAAATPDAPAGARAGRGGRDGAAARPPLDLSKINFPILVVNGEYDRPIAKSHRLLREGKYFTSVMLPGKGHLSAIVEGFIPPLYIDSYVAFITSNNPK